MIELKHEQDNQTLRSNGRKFNEGRAIHCQLGIMKNPNISGSALFQIGNTKVAAFLNGPHQVSLTTYKLKHIVYRLHKEVVNRCNQMCLDSPQEY
jgi:ribonuclease PH